MDRAEDDTGISIGSASARKPRAAVAVRNPRGQATRTRILNAAEELFGLQGFKATTLREIAAAAEVELGLTTYYFASKQGLIQQVLERRAGFGARALDYALDQVEQAGRGDDPAAILTAFAETILVPLEREHPSGLNYLRLVIQRASEIHDAFGPDDPIMVPHFPVRARYIEALARAMPGVERAKVHFGFEIFESAFSKMLFAGRLNLDDVAARRGRIAEMRHILVPFCTAGLSVFEAGTDHSQRSGSERGAADAPDVIRAS